MRSAVFWGLGIVLVWGIVFQACKKEKIIVQGSRTDTIYIEPNLCKDTVLDINCYTEYFRGGTERIVVREDTIIISEGKSIVLGNCSAGKFKPLYTLIVTGIYGGRIPDTSMCRNAGLPLCCPYYDTTMSCVGSGLSSGSVNDDSQLPFFNDIQLVSLRFVPTCSRLNTLEFNLPVFGPTYYVFSPDSNPSFSCYDYMMDISDKVCSAINVKNCRIRLIDVQNIMDTVRSVYLPQGPPDPSIGVPTITKCCGPAIKDPENSTLNISAKIGIVCSS